MNRPSSGPSRCSRSSSAPIHLRVSPFWSRTVARCGRPRAFGTGVAAAWRCAASNAASCISEEFGVAGGGVGVGVDVVSKTAPSRGVQVSSVILRFIVIDPFTVLILIWSVVCSRGLIIFRKRHQGTGVIARACGACIPSERDCAAPAVPTSRAVTGGRLITHPSRYPFGAKRTPASSWVYGCRGRIRRRQNDGSKGRPLFHFGRTRGRRSRHRYRLQSRYSGLNRFEIHGRSIPFQVTAGQGGQGSVYGRRKPKPASLETRFPGAYVGTLPTLATSLEINMFSS